MDSKNKLKVSVLKLAVAIGISFAIVCIIIFAVSDAPLTAIHAMFIGPFTTLRRFSNIIEAMTPLMFTGLSVILLYRAGLFNLSMEGGFFISAVVATACATLLKLPAGLNLIVAVLAAALAGGISSLIPGLLRVKCQANELVTSLMLNYVLLYLGLYLVINFMHDPSQNANYSYAFPENMQFARLFNGTRINAGTFVALLCVVLVYILLNKTSFGYKVTMIGLNKDMASASGINVGWVIILSQMIGGMLTGVGASMEMFGMYKRFQYSDLPGFGWDGVLIAIVAQFKPEFVPLSSFFLAYVRIGADIMARTTNVPAEIITIIQAVVIVLISAEALLSHYQRRVVVKQTLKEVTSDVK